MAEQIERLTNLLALLLEARVPLTLEAIGHELPTMYPAGESARRGAFERDKRMLREVGVPIDGVVLTGEQAGQTGYSVDRSRYELRDLTLTPDEERALQVAVAAVRNSDAAFGLLKLGAAAAPAGAMSVPLPTNEWLPLLRQAAAERRTVSFRYRDVDRSIDPYALMLRNGFWYLMGFDHQHQEVRTFRADRIIGEPTSGEPASFQRPADFDPRQQFPADARMLGDAEGSEIATVRVDHALAGLVAVDPTVSIAARGPDGSVDIEVPCGNRDAFRSWLFGLGEHAVVVGPADVRNDVVAWLSAVAGQ